MAQSAMSLESVRDAQIRGQPGDDRGPDGRARRRGDVSSRTRQRFKRKSWAAFLPTEMMAAGARRKALAKALSPAVVDFFSESEASDFELDRGVRPRGVGPRVGG